MAESIIALVLIVAFGWIFLRSPESQPTNEDSSEDESYYVHRERYFGSGSKSKGSAAVTANQARPSLPKQKEPPPKARPLYNNPGLASITENLHTTLTGKCTVVDGDTIRIGTVSIRLAGIDAPELEHPWGQKAKWALVHMVKGQVIIAEIEPEMSYDRVVATCYLPDGRDLSAEMVKIGLALDWAKFSKGKYAALEPEGVRQKLWKPAARQRGDMVTFHK